MAKTDNVLFICTGNSARSTARWGMPDPAAVEGSLDVRRQAFLDTAVTMERRIELMRSLPLELLDAMAIQRQVKEIGAQ